MQRFNRRALIKSAGATAAIVSATPSSTAEARANTDSLPTQLYKSLSEEQRGKICLAVDHPKRQFISNWWYVHREHRINNTFSDEQRELIQKIFDSMHSPEHQAAVNKQVKIDQYGEAGNAPSVGFFGTPEDEAFEFIYTGHHVTRRCNAHDDQGHGFGGAPIFYGHFPDEFHESKDHPGNPYWYQGKIFNKFVQALDGDQQTKALANTRPRSEKPNSVIQMRSRNLPGLACADLSSDQKQLMLETMRDMLAMFRAEDVKATMDSIRESSMIDELYVSYYGGRYDIGSDQVWDTWQIEGPNLVWYYRGEPHIHSYLHLKS